MLCRYNPIKTIKTSFVGTMNMLGLAKRTRARFLLTSTSEVRLALETATSNHALTRGLLHGASLCVGSGC